jgi:uncharacterized membrane protein
MKWLLIALCCLSAALVVAGVLGFVYVEETKPFVDFYANHFSVLGFFVSIVGFILTVAAVFETLRVSKKGQEEIQTAAREAREETRELLAKIRLKIMEDVCDQTYSFATEARHAIRTGSWLRVVERCHDARQLALRLLTFRDLADVERDVLLAVVDGLKTTVAFIERNRLKDDAPSGMPEDKLQPIDSLIDVLEKVRSRLQQQVLEISHADTKKD